MDEKNLNPVSESETWSLKVLDHEVECLECGQMVTEIWWIAEGSDDGICHECLDEWMD